MAAIVGFIIVRVWLYRVREFATGTTRCSDCCGYPDPTGTPANNGNGHNPGNNYAHVYGNGSASDTHSHPAATNSHTRTYRHPNTLAF